MAIKISGETVIDDSKKGLFNDVVVNGGSGESGEITLNCENNSHGVKLKGPAHSAGADYTLTLPETSGNSGEVLTTDGTGAMSWAEVVGNEISTTAPTSPSVGALWTDTSEDPTSPILKTWNGSQWVTVGASLPSEYTGVINNVTLTENDPTGDRFTSQSFDVTIDMLREGSPFTQKGLKASVEGSFTTFNSTDALTSYNNSITTDVFTTSYNSNALSNQQDYAKSWYVYVGEYNNDNRLLEYFMRNGQLYIYAVNTDGSRGSLLKQISVTSEGLPYMKHSQVLNRNGLITFHGMVDEAMNYRHWRYIALASNPVNGGDVMQGGYYQSTTDGHFLWSFNSGGELNALYNPNDPVDFSLTKGITGYGTAWMGTNNSDGLVYSQAFNDKGGFAYIEASDELVLLRYYSSAVRMYRWKINRKSTTPDSTWITRLNNNTTMVSSLSAWRGSWDLGSAGFWFIVSESNGNTGIYKYNHTNATLEKKSNVPSNVLGTQGFKNFGMGVDLDGNIQICNTGNTVTFARSTNDGYTWQAITDTVSNSASSNISVRSYASSGDREIWGFNSETSGNVNGIRPTRLFSNQTATVTPSSLDVFGDTENITKLGDEDNTNYKGVLEITNRSTGQIKLTSAGLWQNGDVVVSRVGGTSGVSTKYLVLDSVGNVTNLISSDPGYVTVGPNTSQTLTFPATFTSGNAPDSELPAGTTIKVSAQATNSVGSNEYGPSNIITPS